MFKGLFNNSKEKGNYYEQLAESFLKKHGLRCIARNYYCKFGEIDLIMKDAEQWVFVEVKYRQSSHFGGVLSALGYTKQQRLKRSIYHYLTEQKLHNVPLRVDFIAIEGQNPPNIQWIKSVF
jgi:putative endonuclease